jgi:uncharacterized damage-inducible protein DinB
MTPGDFAIHMQISHAIVTRNASRITHEQSLVRPQPAGNCLNWVLGHLVATRCDLLRALGAEPVWDKSQRAAYERHGPPIEKGADATPLEEIWKAYNATQERLLAATSKLTPEQLERKAGFSPSNNPNETIGSLLGTLAFHDAYHTGQTGILRRIAGEPPADL